MDKIISDLSVIAKLEPGKTLSSSTMTVIDHNAWSTSIWRLSTGENRKNTITTINHILLDAISIYQITPDQNLLHHIMLALRGFETLKETYTGDYYTIGDITQIIKTITNKLLLLNTGASNTTALEEIPTLNQCVQQIVQDNLSNINVIDPPGAYEQLIINELNEKKNLFPTNPEPPSNNGSILNNETHPSDFTEVVSTRRRMDAYDRPE